MEIFFTSVYFSVCSDVGQIDYIYQMSDSNNINKQARLFEAEYKKQVACETESVKQKVQLSKFLQNPVKTDSHKPTPITRNNANDNLLNIKQNNV